jgi:hypothetical protein
MRHVRFGWACWLVVAVAPACEGCDGPWGPGSDGDGGDGEVVEGELECRTSIAPFRDEWRIEADVAFPHRDGGIASLQVGGQLFDGNFGNRGDVIVEFDGEPDRIVVEMRRFTTAASEAAAREDFEALHLWTFSGSVDSPRPPFDMAPEQSCTAGVWKDGCGIRVWYDGLSQLARAGADLRVTLPADYFGALNVVTEDNDDGTGYANRGNVCIDGASAGVDVRLQSGEAFVIVGEDAVPTPSCPPEDIAQCEAWAAGAWALECPCLAQGHEFGAVRVRTSPAGAADVTVDLPEGLWAAINLANDGPAQDARDPNTHCEAQALFADLQPSATDDFPWTVSGSIHVPSDAATIGAGFFVDAVSEQCGPLLATESPEQYDCVDEEQDSEVRGNLSACTGCLRARSCDALLP